MLQNTSVYKSQTAKSASLLWEKLQLQAIKAGALLVKLSPLHPTLLIISCSSAMLLLLVSLPLSSLVTAAAAPAAAGYELIQFSSAPPGCDSCCNLLQGAQAQQQTTAQQCTLHISMQRHKCSYLANLPQACGASYAVLKGSQRQGSLSCCTCLHTPLQYRSHS
jgi:hypothetical protein